MPWHCAAMTVDADGGRAAGRRVRRVRRLCPQRGAADRAAVGNVKLWNCGNMKVWKYEKWIIGLVGCGR